MISTLQEVVDHLVPDHDFGTYLVRSQVDVVLLHPKPAGQIILQHIGGRPPADAVELGVRLSHALPRRVPPQAIPPGGSDTFDTTPGTHIVAINFAAGGIACTPAVPSVAECQTFGLVCRA